MPMSEEHSGRGTQKCNVLDSAGRSTPLLGALIQKSYQLYPRLCLFSHEVYYHPGRVDKHINKINGTKT